MAGFKIEKFGGMAPNVSLRLLAPNMAQTAQNCKLRSGALVPWKDTTFVWTPTKVGTKLSLYKFAGQYWFHWLSDVDCVRGPIAGDAYERTYFTGDGVPKMTYSPLAVSGGGTDYPINSYDLGIPAPTVAPTLVVQGTPPTDPADAVSRAYVYTYVSGVGEEGPPSPASAVVDVGPAQTVDVTMAGAPTGAYNVTHKRIYRAVSGTNATEYQFVAEVAVATGTYNDAIADANLGEVIPSSDWAPPPSTMKGLTMMPNGIAVGFVGQDLYFSEPFLPHAWPSKYSQPTDYPIVAISATDESLIVATEGTPYIVTGTDPAAMSVRNLNAEQACVSKRSLVGIGNAVYYASPDGLVAASAAGAPVVTEPYLSRDDWQALNPSSIHAYHLEGCYIGFYDTGVVQGGFVFDPKGVDAALTFIDVYATAGHNVLTEDALYLQVGNDIVKWDSAATKKTLTWRGARQRFAKPVNLGWGRVKAKGYPVTFKLYALNENDGTMVLKHTQTVANGKPFRLPAGYKAEEVEPEISGAYTVQAVLADEDIEALA